jgi:hypothetical protein
MTTHAASGTWKRLLELGLPPDAMVDEMPKNTAVVASAILGCLVDIINRTLHHAMCHAGEQVDADRVGVHSLVAKLYGSMCHQSLHAHGFGTSRLSLRAAKQVLDEQGGSALLRNPVKLFLVLGQMAAAAVNPSASMAELTAEPGSNLDACVGSEDNASLLYWFKKTDEAAKPNQQLDILLKVIMNNNNASGPPPNPVTP